MSALLGVHLIEVSLYFIQYSQNTPNVIFSDWQPFTFSPSMKLLIQNFFSYFFLTSISIPLSRDSFLSPF